MAHKLHSAMSAPDRFEASYTPEPNSGCWLWLATAYAYPSGDRPYLVVEGRKTLANRFAYRMYKGPTGSAWVLHTCHNSFCVNPDHLYLGTPKQNSQDMMRAGNHFSQRNPEAARARALAMNAIRRAATRCKRGHSLADAYLNKNGHRSCKECKRLFAANRRKPTIAKATGAA